MSYTFLQPGFTQDIVGVGGFFMGGVAFAPDGDPLVDQCLFSGSPLHRYDLQGVAPPAGGTPLHPESVIPSNAGCGLTNHPNGALYSNTSGGVVKLDATTGATLAGPFGPSGRALGIAVDPLTSNLVYVGSDGTLYFVDAGLTTSGTFSTVTTGNLIDGLFFDPTGSFLFAANRSPVFRLTILNNPGGTLVQHVPMSSEPDGISFHALAPKFVISNNTDGTITRFDFPGDNFTMVPTQSVFASGGFRGDLSQVGPDGCVYITQDGTRLNNGSTPGGDSLVRICPGFAPPPGVTPVATCPAALVPTIVGTSGDDNLVGTPGNDVIFGLGGNDKISGGGGDDIICGGDGNDQLFGGDGNDTLYGDAGNDKLVGGAGNDKLYGGPGDDQLTGLDGNDELHGGPGVDYLLGGVGDDVLEDTGAPGDFLDGGPHVAGDTCTTEPGDTVTTCNP